MSLAPDRLGVLCVRQPKNVVFRTFPSETVVLNLDRDVPWLESDGWADARGAEQGHLRASGGGHAGQ